MWITFVYPTQTVPVLKARSNCCKCYCTCNLCCCCCRCLCASLYCFMAYSYSFRLPNPFPLSHPSSVFLVLIKCLAYFLGPTAALVGNTSLQLAVSTLPGCPLYVCVCVLSACRVWLYVYPARLSVGAHMIYEWVTNLLPCSLSNQRRLCSPFFAFFIIVAMSLRLYVRVCVCGVCAIVSVHTLAIATCTTRWEPSRLDR